jgi:uncharacterized DUF497 family protein
MFEWNEQKAARNAREHKGVTFEEAATIFNDPDVYISARKATPRERKHYERNKTD